MSLFRGGRGEESRLLSVPWNVDGGPASMTTDRALSVVPVYAAVKLIAETASTLPLQIYSMIKIAVTPEVNAVSSLLMLLTLCLILIASRLSPSSLKSHG